jgi:hypothetical protein
LNPDALLQYSTTYTAIVTTGLQDLAGNHLAADFSWTFTTEPAPDTTPPTVSGVTPTAGNTDVDVDATIRATFSEDVLPASVNVTTMTLTGGSGAVAASVTLSGTVASLRPDAPLEYATSYTAKVTTGVQDLTGNHLASDFTWSFTTQAPPDTTGPTVGSVTPAEGATLVAVNTNVSAALSDSIDPASVTASTFTVRDAAGPVAGVRSVSGANITFNPSANLATNTVYTATLTTGIRGIDGNSLATNFFWSFTTTHLAPTANAGPDQTVGVGSTVRLDGTRSTDPEGQPLTYSWQQVRGDPVNGGNDLTGPTPTFTAPLLPQRVEFQLRVSDGDFTSGPNRVRIDVVVLPLSARAPAQ